MMSEEKKIIIDEDWKSKVRAEKEKLSEQSRDQPAAASSGSEREGDIPLPPASFQMLLTTLATEALVALGQVPHPALGKSVYHPQQARYFIDTIEMLEEKTRGNLTGEESQAIEDLLHQLRMAFLAGPPPAEPETGQ